ncbi:L-2,4-diaminobutyrate decarboxylase [hydrothermal vent metagenome]|uniref:L-2,4-diaminobutyrate decarboxylase n=1 Tax=hydrothermal vent metagenome TaxID=652676 RepID=A0A3B0S163_9ZZZZ
MSITPDEATALGHKVWTALQNYRAESEAGQTPVLLQKSAEELAANMGLEGWLRNGGLSVDNVEKFLKPYLADSQHMHHPGFVGHQVAVPHLGCSIADMVHGVVNNPMAVYEMGPTAAVIERVVVNWMLEKIGWRPKDSLTDFENVAKNGAGVLTHGGSLANLTAILAARAAIAPNAWEDGVPNNLALIAPAASHYSMARAVSIAGFGQKALHLAAVDALEVLRPEQLEKTWARATEAGQQVFLVSVNACTTATGLYDPIDEVADFCAAHNLWLHVDGAHGASALLSSCERQLMKGIERADSMIWDAHKMLQTSALCAGVLFRNQRHLVEAFQQEGSYIFYGEDQPGFDVAPFTVECTKAHLGTKLFWVLAMEGEAGMAKFVEKQYADTKDFYRQIQAEPDFSCPYKPQSNILCFLHQPDAPGKQSAIRKKVLERGKFYITTAEVNGIRYLRLAIMNPLTTRQTIADLLDEIRICAKLV